MATNSGLYTGVDIGSTTVKVAGINASGQLIGEPVYLRQDSFPSQADAVKTALRQYLSTTELKVSGLGITGSGREFNEVLLGADVTRTEIFAHAVGIRHLLENIAVWDDAVQPQRLLSAGTLIEIGGQDAKVIVFDQSGLPVFFNMNTICSAGTGEFLKQLADEAGLSLEELGPMALRSEQPAEIDATCTVFSKRDFRHLTQKGVPLPDRLMGVCHALVRNYLTNVVQHNHLLAPVFFQGGVAHNEAIRQAFSIQLQQPVYITPHHAVAGALGMALIARAEKSGNVEAISRFHPDFFSRTVSSRIRYCHGCANGCELVQPCEERSGETVVLNTLGGRCDGCKQGRNVHSEPQAGTYLQLPLAKDVPAPKCILASGQVTRSSADCFFAGLDGGSRGTKYALIRSTSDRASLASLEIMTAGTVDTGGDAITACMSALRELAAALPAGATLAGIGTTGSAGELFRDIVTEHTPRSVSAHCTEIIAHYTWACHHTPAVGTVMDIGGNDAKIVVVTDTGLDFGMNDKCAAGTGSFLEAAARRLHVPIEQYGKVALQADQPARVSGRCAVFGESDLVHKARSGFSTPDLLLGLAFAICRTYLSDVGRSRLVRLPVVAQGGVFLNEAVLHAFRTTLGLNSEQFVVDPDPRRVLCAGALGAALTARSRFESGFDCHFKGFATILQNRYSTQTITCRHPECQRQCAGLVLLLENNTPLAGYKAVDCQFGHFSGLAGKDQQVHMERLLATAN